MTRAHTYNLGFTWQGLTNTQFGAHITRAQTIWGSHGQGSHTHTILNSLGLGSHTHTQFGAHISQSQSKFILVLFLYVFSAIIID